MKYEIVTTATAEVDYSFKYKKGHVYIEAVSGDRSEKFELVKPPKEKK